MALAADPVQRSEEEQENTASTDEREGGRRRYIVFVGNLPYRVSAADVELLFSSMRPVSCRLPTDRENRKPKGYAFVEFDDAASMRVTLHSLTLHCTAHPAATSATSLTPLLCCLCSLSSVRCSFITVW